MKLPSGISNTIESRFPKEINEDVLNKINTVSNEEIHQHLKLAFSEIEQLKNEMEALSFDKPINEETFPEFAITSLVITNITKRIIKYSDLCSFLIRVLEKRNETS